MRIIQFYAAFILLISCTPLSNIQNTNNVDVPKFEFNISSYGSKIIDSNKYYFLKLGNQMNGSLDDIQNIDYLKCVESMLNVKNYKRINDSTSNLIKYIITVSWSISDQQKRNVVVPAPVTGLIPNTFPQVGSQSTTSTITKNYFDNSYTVKTVDNTPSSPLNIPTMGIVGYAPTQIELINYERKLDLICTQKNSTNALWIVKNRSTGSGKDLRYLLKALSFASINFIEYDSKIEQTISIREDNNDFLDFISEKEYPISINQEEEKVIFDFKDIPKQSVADFIKIGDLEVSKQDLSVRMSWENAKKVVKELKDGWRLPNRKELDLLYENRKIIGGFKNKPYWSLTENGFDLAWQLSFLQGEAGFVDKGNFCNVRVVRSVYNFN